MFRRMGSVEPLKVEELMEPIPLGEVESWVQRRCERYTTDPEWSGYFLGRRGLTKDLQDELIPLALFCKQVAPRLPGAVLRYFQGSGQSFDAKIVLPDGSEVETLEVTVACDGYRDALVRESLSCHGFAPLYSEIPQTGARSSRELPEPEMVSIDARAMVSECSEQVRTAVERKSSSGKYVNTNLIVAFDDFRLLSVDDFEQAITTFRAIQSSFPVVYYVGLTGRVFTQSDR